MPRPHLRFQSRASGPELEIKARFTHRASYPSQSAMSIWRQPTRVDPKSSSGRYGRLSLPHSRMGGVFGSPKKLEIPGMAAKQVSFRMFWKLTQNDRPLYPKVPHNSLKVAQNFQQLDSCRDSRPGIYHVKRGGTCERKQTRWPAPVPC